MKDLFAFCISLLPLNMLRVQAYRLLFGYRIAPGAKIGLCTVITVHRLTMGASVIGRGNRFRGHSDIMIGNGAIIGNNNEFICTKDAARKRTVGDGMAARLTLGDRVHLTNGHLLDASGGMTVGEQTRLAGRRSEFWTHGGDRADTSITIGKRCYVASNVRFAPGVSIDDNVFVGLGSVVVKTVPESNCQLFGFPAEVVKRGIVARRSLAGDKRGGQ